MVLQNELWSNCPDMVERDIEARYAVIRVYRCQAVSKIVVLINPIAEIVDMPINAMAIVDPVIDAYIDAVIVIRSWSIREIVVRAAGTYAGLIRLGIKREQLQAD